MPCRESQTVFGVLADQELPRYHVAYCCAMSLVPYLTGAKIKWCDGKELVEEKTTLTEKKE